MKIYLSGAITGITGYKEHFDRIEKALIAAGHEVINPAVVNDPLPPSTTHKEYMHVSFALLDLCDTIFMLDGWDKSNGARQEFEYAARHRKTIAFEGSNYG